MNPRPPRNRLVCAIIVLCIGVPLIVWLLSVTNSIEYRILVVTLCGGALVIYLLLDTGKPPGKQ